MSTSTRTLELARAGVTNGHHCKVGWPCCYGTPSTRRRCWWPSSICSPTRPKSPRGQDESWWQQLRCSKQKACPKLHRYSYYDLEAPTMAPRGMSGPCRPQGCYNRPRGDVSGHPPQDQGFRSSKMLETKIAIKVLPCPGRGDEMRRETESHHLKISKRS